MPVPKISTHQPSLLLIILAVIALVDILFLDIKPPFLQKPLTVLPTPTNSGQRPYNPDSAPGQVNPVPSVATPPPKLEITLPCPTIAEFCRQGKDVTKNGAYAGFGGNPAPGSPLIAVIDGEMTTVESIYPPQIQKEKIAAIYIDNPQKQMRAAYYFKGQVPKARTVKSGENIASVTDNMALYQNYSLLFQVISGDPIKGQRLKISSANFTY